MIDQYGQTLEIGDVVTFSNRYYSAIGRIMSMEDPWALDQWIAVVECTIPKFTISKVDCCNLKKLDDEQAMLYILENTKV